MTEGSPNNRSFVKSLYQLANAKRHPTSLRGEQPEMGEVYGLNFSFLSQLFLISDHFTIAWGIRATNLICQIIDFQPHAW